ncbi:hypothetical protein FNT36_10320 [Hymenobacter setariae]|uniref:Uncharacterized protein n=1 Tax=Hymenobacter setariae TaxID=2594794 RepID=A0A558BZ71_9BACT|nr:hypothetical protein [Hymenobacter setariae]TVT41808.1 hypothetical protein FNT36_10320 [Hymenobacter setariae]
MAAPRLRQLRRDKTIFSLCLNIIRLHLEENALIGQQPELREAPDTMLLLVQQSIDQWVSLATGHIMQKHNCAAGDALQLLGELQNEMKANIPAAEVWQIPLPSVLALPPELLASQQPQAAEEPAVAKEEE